MLLLWVCNLAGFMVGCFTWRSRLVFDTNGLDCNLFGFNYVELSWICCLLLCLIVLGCCIGLLCCCFGSLLIDVIEDLIDCWLCIHGLWVWLSLGFWVLGFALELVVLCLLGFLWFVAWWPFLGRGYWLGLVGLGCFAFDALID